jgi:hypothetical protein
MYLMLLTRLANFELNCSATYEITHRGDETTWDTGHVTWETGTWDMGHGTQEHGTWDMEHGTRDMLPTLEC